MSFRQTIIDEMLKISYREKIQNITNANKLYNL